jgi:hypothetical protein
MMYLRRSGLEFRASQAGHWWSRAPLLLCYVAFPLSNQLAIWLGTELHRNWIDAAWVLLVGGSLSVWPCSPLLRPTLMSRVWITALCLTGAVFVAWNVYAGHAPGAIGAMELKPLAYLLLCTLFLSRVSAPSAQDFCHFGTVLALLLITEAVVYGLLAGSIVRPLGSGEVNYDGALLCLALVFAGSDRFLARRYGWWIWAGIVVSLSRTSLVAALLVLLFSPAFRPHVRILMGSVAAMAVLVSFTTRGLPMEALEDIDRYWMWVIGIMHFLDSPMATAINLFPGAPVDVVVPEALRQLWTDQQEGADVVGVYPFQFHSLWLRLALTWGWLPLAAVLSLFVRVCFLSRTRATSAGAFGAACLALGMAMGLLYLGNVGFVVLLAGYRVYRSRRPNAASQRWHNEITAWQVASDPGAERQPQFR